MNYIVVANETLRIIGEGFYEKGGRRVELAKKNYAAVEVYSPGKGAELLAKTVIPGGEMCGISVTTEDSFAAARRFERPFVMNFANAHRAGGGFRLGARAQEESLCRCSTLYASISCPTAREMYRHNNTHLGPVESDYMLYSPEVCIFRDERCELLDEPFLAAVATVPAPNRRGAAMFASNREIAEAMVRRIRIMLAIAANHGHRNLVLGAWGCGAFGNRPEEVAGHFRRVLVEEGFGRLFGKVCFAIYGREDGRNYLSFKGVFGR